VNWSHFLALQIFYSRTYNNLVDDPWYAFQKGEQHHQ
jgi:hypothetical protein